MNVNFKWVLYLLNVWEAMGNWGDIKTKGDFPSMFLGNGKYLLRSWSSCTHHNTKCPKWLFNCTLSCVKKQAWVGKICRSANERHRKPLFLQSPLTCKQCGWHFHLGEFVIHTNSNSKLLSSSFLDVLYLANMYCSSVRIALPSVLGESTMEVDRCYKYNAVRGWNEV